MKVKFRLTRTIGLNGINLPVPIVLEWIEEDYSSILVAQSCAIEYERMNNRTGDSITVEVVSQ